MIAAPDASNRLIADLCGKSGTSVNVDLLFGFAARALHSHHNIARVRHQGLHYSYFSEGLRHT
jgi:hypothetical protein